MNEASNQVISDEIKETQHIDEVLKNSTLNNPDLTFCEKTTYLDFLLSNAQTEEEEAEIKSIVNSFLEMYSESDDEKNEM